MLIREYGLFWERDEVKWRPGRGTAFELLGRRGLNKGTIQVADFQQQSGLYVLYGNYGPHYVGLTEHGLGYRLRDHIADKHKGSWNRFSWFGFNRVLKSHDERGIKYMASDKGRSVGTTHNVIREMEALLIKALGLPSNLAATKFPGGCEWRQVKIKERNRLVERVCP